MRRPRGRRRGPARGGARPAARRLRRRLGAPQPAPPPQPPQLRLRRQARRPRLRPAAAPAARLPGPWQPQSRPRRRRPHPARPTPCPPPGRAAERRRRARYAVSTAPPGARRRPIRAWACGSVGRGARVALPGAQEGCGRAAAAPGGGGCACADVAADTHRRPWAAAAAAAAGARPRGRLAAGAALQPPRPRTAAHLLLRHPRARPPRRVRSGLRGAPSVRQAGRMVLSTPQTAGEASGLAALPVRVAVLSAWREARQAARPPPGVARCGEAHWRSDASPRSASLPSPTLLQPCACRTRRQLGCPLREQPNVVCGGVVPPAVNNIHNKHTASLAFPPHHRRLSLPCITLRSKNSKSDTSRFVRAGEG